MESEKGPEKTPTRPSTSKVASQTDTLKSTPHNRGSAVRSDHIAHTGVQVSDIRPWIARDVERAQVCNADALLDLLLQRLSDQNPRASPDQQPPPAKELRDRCLAAVLPICNGKPIKSGANSITTSAIKTHLQNYANLLIEKDRYKPWISAFNIALEVLRHTAVDGLPAAKEADGEQIIFQQNDPAEMRQQHRGRETRRKPDVVIVPTKISEKADPKPPQNPNGIDTRKPKRSTWLEYALNYAVHKPSLSMEWKDILSVVEFKSKRHKLRGPPTSYPIQGYEAPQGSYLSTDALKLLDPPEDAEAVDPAVTSVTAPTASSSKAPTTSAISSSKAKAKRAPSSLMGTSKSTRSEPLRRSSRKSQPTSKAIANAENDRAISERSGLKRKREEGATGETSSKRGKVQPQKKTKKPVATVQTAIYSAEMLAANLGTNHLINLIVLDSMVWVWLYDRQNPIQCSGIDFIQDLPRFLVLLFCLQRLSPENWGRNTLFRRVGGSGSESALVVKAGDVDLTLHEDTAERVTHFGVNGRSTNLFRVTSPQLEEKHPGKEMVAKVFWPEDSRSSEAAILDKVAELAKGNPNIENHVPELLFWHKFENSTAELRRALGIANPENGSRTLYILVFRKLSPITELSGAEFLSAWWDCVLCHRDLWKGGVHHRDISAGNLMYYKDDSGRVVGVLNDFDLATFVIGKGPTGNQRTGTVPFMARDLLTKEGLDGEITHIYRHEVESFIWVLVWICLRFDKGCERDDTSRCLDQWLKADEEQCRKEKGDILTRGVKYSPSLSHEDNWVLAGLLMRLLQTQDVRPRNLGKVAVPAIERPDDVVFADFKAEKEVYDTWLIERRVQA